MAIIHNDFFEGQTRPNLALESIDNIDWYNEQLQYAFEGRSKNGYRMTADHYWYLNFCPIQRVVLDSKGRATDKFTFDFPLWSQEDDYLFKQIEEAHQDKKAVMLFTGRGFGKTYGIISIASKLYHCVDRSHSVISASGNDHADETFSKMKAMLDGMDTLHPTLSLARLYDKDDYVESGQEIISDGFKKKVGKRSVIQQVVYDKKAGKTKGKRLDFQLFEESGDWGGAASLKECIGASEGSWKVGGIVRCRVFYIGTGGTVLSTQAKEIFNNPDAFNIYKVYDWNKRGTGIFMPAYKKYGGFWEETGVSDYEGAKEHLNKIRDDKRQDAVAYSKFVQEFPFTPDECFMLKGGNRFDQGKISDQVNVLDSGEGLKGEMGNLHWIKKQGKVVGVEWEKNPSGKIWILEHPERREDGSVFPNLYVQGYDGIDVGRSDTKSGDGSDGATTVKKRMLSGQRLNNAYVCFYVDRPNDIDDLFDNNLKISWYFNTQINIEDTKRGIVGYFKQKGQLHRFMKRPRLTLTDPTSEKESRLIGTTATVKNFEYGENFLAQHVRDYIQNLFYRPALIQLRDFSMDNRTIFDIVVCMMMAELGDDELSDKMIVPEKPNYEFKNIGYYTDANGVKRFGEIPSQNAQAMRFTSQEYLPELLDQRGQAIK